MGEVVQPQQTRRRRGTRYTGGEGDQPNQGGPVILASRFLNAERRPARQRTVSQATAGMQHRTFDRYLERYEKLPNAAPKWRCWCCGWGAGSSAPLKEIGQILGGGGLYISKTSFWESGLALTFKRLTSFSRGCSARPRARRQRRKTFKFSKPPPVFESLSTQS